ncbi:MAG TPA: flagellar biosynthesis anti-sigma factor FlgM [Thermodesulfovibrionia bacterium]|nr:flagellar biosynthesis anti-sigma factor FlgM [Thermodesulfovibrionia bacterium]
MSYQKNNNTSIILAMGCKSCESENTVSQNRLEKKMDMRAEKIGRIKNAIQTGTYQVKGKEVADQILRRILFLKKAKQNQSQAVFVKGTSILM